MMPRAHETPGDERRRGNLPPQSEPTSEPALPQPTTSADRPAVDPASALLAQARVDARSRGRAGANPRRQLRRPTSMRSGSAPDDRDPQTLSTAVSRLLAQRGWEVDVAVHSVMARWSELVGPQVAEHCEPERYEDGELTIRTESTGWATQLRLLAPQVIRRLNGELGADTVRRVTVRGPDAPRWSHGPRSVRGRGPRDTYG